MEPLDPAKVDGRVAAIVPVLDEEEAIGDVVRGLLAVGVVLVIVVDGDSRDGTVSAARAAGATVIGEPRRGYGRAMMTGLAALPADIAIVLFFDGDGSDDVARVPEVVRPIANGSADFVHGSRMLGAREVGSLGAAQIVAGWLAGVLIRLWYGASFTDMSPFRAIRREALAGLGMTEASYGWNLEMQMRVAAAGLRIVELPVGQRCRRGGVSKVSGSPVAALRAAFDIARTFAKLALTLRRERSSSAQASSRVRSG